MNNKKWQTLTMLILTSGLMACSTASQQSVTLTQTTDLKSKPKIELIPVKADKVQLSLPSQPPASVNKQLSAPSSTYPSQRQFGYEEWVYIPGLRQSVKARLDVNRPLSSIYVEDIKVFERNGKEWVQFQVISGDKSSKGIALPVKRWISRANLEEHQAKVPLLHKQAVVETWIQLGNFKDKTDFMLIDNSQSKWPLTLGLSFLKGVASVDSDKKYLQQRHPIQK